MALMKLLVMANNNSCRSKAKCYYSRLVTKSDSYTYALASPLIAQTSLYHGAKKERERGERERERATERIKATNVN